MSSNYPAGSMRGSGIYSSDVTLNATCPNEDCDFQDDLEMATNDWGNTAYGDCPKCDTEISIEIDDDYFDEKPERREPDFD